MLHYDQDMPIKPGPKFQPSYPSALRASYASSVIGMLIMPPNLRAPSRARLYRRGAFFVGTAARIAVLKLLASQAAISLENGRLYDELTVSEDDKEIFAMATVAR